jgi:hypothetical protein
LKSVDRFTVATILGDLRQRVGNGEFGYRAQGLFAHVIIRIGGSVNEIRHQGHPDIIATIDGVTTLVEVEIASAVSRSHVLKADDIESLTTSDLRCAGWLAILDCAAPISWLIVDSNILRLRKPSSLHLATIRALSDRALSTRCTQEFIRMIDDRRLSLYNLTFNLLCSRALSGTAL